MSVAPLIVKELRDALARHGGQLTPENRAAIIREVRRKVQEFFDDGATVRDPKQAQTGDE